ncbi:response regulator [Variovorax sp. RT4R15]|uniref:response regulator n=1 Tax=Variovorax sp. RT4R15 TaxID=3443737 RepID=UPI003F45E364
MDEAAIKQTFSTSTHAELLLRAIEAVELTAHHAFFSASESKVEDAQAPGATLNAQQMELPQQAAHGNPGTRASICASNACLASSISLLEVVHTLIEETTAQSAVQRESRWNKLALDTKTAGRAAYRAALVLLGPTATRFDSEPLVPQIAVPSVHAALTQEMKVQAKQRILRSHWNRANAAGISAGDLIEFLRSMAKGADRGVHGAVPAPSTYGERPAAAFSSAATSRFHHWEHQMNRILIVEDEGIIALSISNTLTRLGYDVVGIAGSWKEAIRLAQLEGPDLVLMDINLGDGPDGIETAALISNDGLTAVIYLTAYSEDATLVRARETEPYGFLLKPFSERELHATIQMALGRLRCDIELAAKEQTFRLALDAADMGVWELDIESNRLERHGPTHGPLSVLGDSFDGSWDGFLNYVAPEDRDAVHQARTDAVYQGGLMSVEFRGLNANGTKPWLRTQARIYGQPGAAAPQRLIGVTQDIASQRRQDADLHQAAALFHGTHDAAFIADENLQLLAVNKAFSVITGHTAADVIGMQIGKWLLRADESQPPLDLMAVLDSSGQWQGELVGMRQCGVEFPAWLTVTRLPVPAGVDEKRIVGTFCDLASLSQADARKFHQEHFDALTGLPNRSHGVEQLQLGIKNDFVLWSAALVGGAFGDPMGSKNLD